MKIVKRRLLEIKNDLMATDMPLWRKKGVFVTSFFFSLFPFFIFAKVVDFNVSIAFDKFGIFIFLAFLQGVAQTSIGWFVLKNPVPNYVIQAYSIMNVLFQLSFGLLIILLNVNHSLF